MSVNPGTSGCVGGNSGGGGGVGGGGGGGGGGPCGACKFLRRKCVPGCVFAPHFDSEQGAAHFAAVHKVFGASNVSKLLSGIPVHRRQDAVITICYEAQARARDPVYGCVSHIFALQQQVMALQTELSFLQAQVASMADLPARPPLPAPPQPPAPLLPPIPTASIQSTMYAQPSYDISSLFDPILSQQASWAAMQRAIDPRQPAALPSTIGDLQALAGELVRGQGVNPLGPTTSSSSPVIPKKE